jgi:hypothetical protein
MLHTEINFAGVIADRQSFLDGARSFTIEAEDRPAIGWRMTLSFRWSPEEDGERVEEGDLTLTDPRGNELYGSLSRGTAAEITDEEGGVAATHLDLTFVVTGGEGAYAAATGTVAVSGTIAGEGPGTGGSLEGEGALLTARLAIAGEDAAAAWEYPPTEDIPSGPARRYQEPPPQAT